MKKKIIIFSFLLLFSSAALAVENQQTQPADTKFQQYNQVSPKEYRPMYEYMQPDVIIGGNIGRRFGYNPNFVDHSFVTPNGSNYGYSQEIGGYYPARFMFINPVSGYQQYKKDNYPEQFEEKNTIVSPEEFNFIPWKR